MTGAGERGTVADPSRSFLHFAVSAHEGPNGVFGSYSSKSVSPVLTFRGIVTCLYVIGDHAVVGGVVTKGGAPGQVGTGFAVGFIDNPSPTPDQVTLTDTFATTPVDCVAEAAGLFTLPLPLVRGNVEVNDAP